MEDRFGNPLREAPGRRGRQLPRLDLTGQNTNAPRRSPAAPPAPARNATPTAPVEIDPRIARTSQAVRGALGQLFEGADNAVGDAVAVGTRLNAAATGGLGRLIGLAAPEVGGDFLASADNQRAFADNAARNGLFTGGNAAPAAQTPRRGQAQAQGAPAAQPEAQTQEEADVRSVLGQRLPGFSLNRQQATNPTNLPLDTGTPVGGEAPSFVVERRGTQAPTLARLGEAQADGRRRVLPTTFEFGGQTFTPAQAEALGPVIAQQINAQGNADAATIRAAQDAQVDARETASRQALGQALTEFDIVSRDPDATDEQVAAAAAEVDRVRRLLITRGISDAERITELAAALQ